MNTHKLKLQCSILTGLAFLMGLSQFIIIGIINNLASSVQTSISQVGLLVTLFAIVYAVATPIINLLVGHVYLHKVLISFFGIFAFSNLLTAVTIDYNTLLVSRVLTALSSGPSISVAITFAAAIAPSEKRAWIVSWVFSGFSIASVFGVPLGTWISDNFNWRLTFWGIFILAVILTILAYFLLPHSLRQTGNASLDSQLKILTDKRILWGILLPILNFGAIYMIYTYLKPLLIYKLGFSHSWMTIILFLYGLCGLISNQISGRIANHDWLKTLGKFILLQAVSLILLSVLIKINWLALTAILLMALTMAIQNSPVQLYYMNIAKEDYPQSLIIASSFNSIFSNVGVAIGSFAGGLVTDSLGLGFLGMFASLFSLASLGVIRVITRNNN